MKIHHKINVPVCIVGGGPVGLFLSSLLSQLNVKHCLIEKRRTPTNHPQAHFINVRTMELLQGHLPRVFDSIVKQMPPSQSWRDFVYCYSVTGRSFARVDHFSNTPKSFWNDSPSNVVHLPQNKLENIMRNDVAIASDEKQGLAQILFGHEVTGYDWYHGNGKQHRVRLRSSKDVQTDASEVSCDYLVAADGASSLVRSSLGIPLEGSRVLQTLLNVHFICKGLSSRLSPRPAMIYFVFNEVAVSVFVAHDPLKDEWVCQIPVFPPYRTPDDFDTDTILQILRSGLGMNENTQEAQIQILSVNSWVMNAEVAAQFSNREADIFLAGDSAHRFPPAGGFGMNTGLQDAHNLAWKLALVVNGGAGRLLLKSYDAERRPVAQANTKLSLENYEKSCTSARLLGVDPVLAKLAVSSVSAIPYLPFKAKKIAVNAALSTGLSTLKWLKNDSNGVSELRVKALQSQIKQGNSLPLIFPKEDIDFQYSHRDSLLIPFGDKLALSMVGGPSSMLRIGARIPHVWFQSCGGVIDEHAMISSVHLPSRVALSRGGPCVVLLLLAPIEEANRWKSDVSTINAFRLMHVVTPGVINGETSRDGTSSFWTHESLQFRGQQPCHEGTLDIHRPGPPEHPHFNGASQGKNDDCVLADVTGCWTRTAQAARFDQFVIAIRPDGHVAAMMGAENFGSISESQRRSFIRSVQQCLYLK